MEFVPCYPASEFDCATYRTGQWRIPRNDTYPDRCKVYTWCNNGNIEDNEVECFGSSYFNKATQGGDFCTAIYSESYCARKG